MKLVLALGNPDTQYARTRHNAGWWVFDYMYGSLGFERAFGGIYYKRGDLLLVMTEKYRMNDHGILAKDFCDFYKIPVEDVIVIYDDLDFAPGTIRVKVGGSAGGHNGIKSLIQHIGEGFTRVRVGIGRPERDILGYVLSEPADDEWPALKEGVGKAAEAVQMLLKDGATATMNKVNK
jgi:PTH1 family peptidyl-tRNA hydrolase